MNNPSSTPPDSAPPAVTGKEKEYCELMGSYSSGVTTPRTDAGQLERELTAAHQRAARLEGTIKEVVILAQENWSSKEYFRSNPEKHVVVYRIWELLREALENEDKKKTL